MRPIQNAITTLFRCILFVATLAPTTLATAQVMHQVESVPGGVVVIELGHYAEKPEVEFFKSRVLVVEEPNTTGKSLWYAIVGIPLQVNEVDVKPGKYFIWVMPKQQNRHQLSFDIHAKKYLTQYITLPPEKSHSVEPDLEAMKRVETEYAIIQKAAKTWEYKPNVPLKMEPPVVGIFTGSFGLKRFYNNKPRRPHSGMDIAAPRGTPIKVSAPGKVILTGDFFFAGNTVFVDHGQGLISMYCHMDSISTQLGHHLKQGEVLGTVGSTGRATGPHLHWSVYLNNTVVNPALFIPKSYTHRKATPRTKKLSVGEQDRGR